MANQMRSPDVYFTTEECEGPSTSQADVSSAILSGCSAKYEAFAWNWLEEKYLFRQTGVMVEEMLGFKYSLRYSEEYEAHI